MPEAAAMATRTTATAGGDHGRRRVHSRRILEGAAVRRRQEGGGFPILTAENKNNDEMTNSQLVSGIRSTQT